ncbi:MAG: glycerol-3-phosphate dehydrogenase [Candidatus Xenobia bacterium]
MATRDFSRLNGSFDLCIIGGGINGAGLARDAAMRGLSVALVEKGDFASGTSSQSSKLIHGGIRYLQNGDFKLVFEALHERWMLTKLAPHLVRPLQFLLPVLKSDPVQGLMLKAGLTLYDTLAGFHNIHGHRMLSRSQVLEAEPTLDTSQISSGAYYYDCQMNDSRLCLENVLSSMEHGAVCVNHAAVTEFVKAGPQLVGAVVQDRLSGATATVHFKVAVNATGPWSDQILRLSEPTPPKPRLRPSKGIHVVVPRRTSGEAMLVRTRDQRVIFVLPWGRYSLVGTTETEYRDDPDKVSASEDDVMYLLEELRRLFPSPAVDRKDVFGTFAGLRPLVDSSSLPAGKLSREHSIITETSGLLTVIGGKYTTYRVVARELADRVMERLHKPGASLTHTVPLYGGDTGPMPAFLARHLARAVSVTGLESTAEHVLRAYGSRADDVLRCCQEVPRGTERLCLHTDTMRGEVAYAFTTEMAQTVEDFMLRRTWIGYGECGGRDAWPAVREVLVDHLGRDADAMDAQWLDVNKRSGNVSNPAT